MPKSSLYPSRGPRYVDIGSLRRSPVVREALPTADGPPSPLLWGMIRDAWLREIERRAKQANCVIDPSSSFEKGPEMAAVVDVLYRAMVAWTGPGGSDAFLEMFALSEVRLPPLWFASSLRFERNDSGSHFLWREHSKAGIPHGFSQVCPDPLTSAHKVGSTPWRDEILGRLHREGGSGLWSAVLLPSVRVPLLQTLDALQGECRWITGVAAPGFLYRESLLVELAKPWMMPAEIPPSFFVPG